jgi:hypothetical protein
MKNLTWAVACAVLLSAPLTATTVRAAGSTTYTLGSSSQIPAAHGTIRLRTTSNGNVEMRLAIKHLAQPGRIVPGSAVFVVWSRGLAAGALPQNLGALRVDKNLGAKFTAVTAMPTFDVFITCEQSQTATTPDALELLPFHYPSR